ncbi:MAG: hypothetical protein WKG01_08080 [Kofleriaceae bacterium]
MRARSFIHPFLFTAASVVAATSALAGSPSLVGRDVELVFSEGVPAGTVYPAGKVFSNSGAAGTGVVATALYANGGSLRASTGRGTGNLALGTPAHITSVTGTPKSAWSRSRMPRRPTSSIRGPRGSRSVPTSCWT